MSIQAMSWVVDKSTQGGSPLLVLLMIANHTYTNGVGGQCLIDDLAAECRMSERSVRRIIAEKLVPSAELVVHRQSKLGMKGKPSLVFEIPGVVRDGYHRRGLGSVRGNGTDTALSGAAPDKLTGAHRTVSSNGTDTALSGASLTERNRKIQATPPNPPASGGAVANPYRYAMPPKPPNRFQFGCQGGIVVEVLVPIGRRLWRSEREAEKFGNRVDQVRGVPAETVEEFFRLKGFQVERAKIPLDSPACNILPSAHVTSANE